MTELTQKRCIACSAGGTTLDRAEIDRLLGELEGWSVENGHHLVKTYGFADFAEALTFVNEVGAVVEDQGHHPDIHPVHSAFG